MARLTRWLPFALLLGAAACKPHYDGLELRYIVGQGDLSADGLAITEGDVVIVQVQPLADNPYEDYESFDLVTLEAFDESIMQVAPSTDVDKFALLGGKVGKTSVRVKINGDEVDIIDAEVLAQPEVGP